MTRLQCAWMNWFFFFHSAEEYAKAFVIGYSLEDASALLRLDGLYLESFLVTDIKHLKVQFVFNFFFCTAHGRAVPRVFPAPWAPCEAKWSRRDSLSVME